jgi:hypothetical protein
VDKKTPEALYCLGIEQSGQDTKTIRTLQVNILLNIIYFAKKGEGGNPLYLRLAVSLGSNPINKAPSNSAADKEL